MKDHINHYFDDVKNHIDRISWQEIAKAITLLEATYEHNGHIYLIGNGGSAAIASHFANDLNKSVLGHRGDATVKRFRAVALTDNIPVLTAWANDLGYEHIFSEQLKNFIQEKDLLIAISSSGNSVNIIKAVEVARAHKTPVIGFVGFDGGKLIGYADAKIHVPSKSYFVVEGLHDVLTHLIIDYFYEKFKGKAGDFS